MICLFFPEIKKVDQVKKLVANLHDKKYIHKKSETIIKSRNSFEKK